MIFFRRFGLIFTYLALTFGCGQRPPTHDTPTFDAEKKLAFAQKFLIQKESITVTEPWPGAVKPITFQLTTPPERIVVTSTTHLPYLEMLGLEQTVVGFPSTQYISSPAFRKLVDSHHITDLGPDGQMNLELLLSLKPDLVIAFDMGQESTSLDKLKEAGIPVIYNADYLESSALGRAEWIKFFGKIFQKEALADSIFDAIRTKYDTLKALGSSVDTHPTILSGVMYGDVWFLPGGENWAAEFYKDAGGAYLWADDKSSGWLELSFESVMEKAQPAEFWIGTSSLNSKAELISQDARYGAFEACKSGNLWSYNKRMSLSGGYDFFESGYARPDLILADLISILHPELLPGYDTYYFQRLP